MFSLDLILLMLAVGAMAGMVTAAFDANLVIQILVAAAASVGALALVRPNLVKRFEPAPTCASVTASWWASRAR